MNDLPSPAANPDAAAHLASLGLCCPVCQGDLKAAPDAYHCISCERRYPIVLGIPDFRVFPDPYIGLVEDHKKGQRVAAHTANGRFSDAVRYYWSITPDVSPDMVERFTRKAILLADKWKEGLPAVERRLPRRPQSLLEIGCGTGGFLVAAARREYPVVGVDIAFRWLVIAQKRLAEAGVSVPLVCACAEHLPFRGNQFDLVFGESVLEHVRDQPQVLREAQRVATAEGHLYLITANRLSIGPDPHVHAWGVGFLPRSLMASYVQLVRGVPYRFLRLVSRFELTRLLRKVGFRSLWFSLPVPTSAEIAQFTPAEHKMLALYRLGLRFAFTRWLLYRVGPLLQVCAAVEKKPSSTG